MSAPAAAPDGSQSPAHVNDPRQIVQRLVARQAVPLIGFAGLMRIVLSGIGFAQLGPLLEARVQRDPSDADALLDLATLLFLTQVAGNRDVALATQARALGLRPLYHLPAPNGRPGLRLLVLMAPGDLSANTPFDCLLEDSDVQAHLLYCAPHLPWPESPPEHDAVFVAIGESGHNQATLDWLEQRLRDWQKPVFNSPARIKDLTRDRVSTRLAQVDGVDIPPTVRIGRAILERIARCEATLASVLPDGAYPVIVRPLGSQGGKGLERVADAPGLLEYLDSAVGEDFFIARFVDYSRADGLFRKYRVVWVAGKPFACHMALSTHWMIHYVNADMDASAAKRAEEERFMRDFGHDFAHRHARALAGINRLVGLDYFGIDCGETADGKLLVFEADNALLVHATDAPDIYPYKQAHMRLIFDAFRAMLGQVAAARPRASGGDDDCSVDGPRPIPTRLAS